jgi:hypothetical protein
MSDPKFASVHRWCALSGMSRTGTYEALRRRYLSAIKVGRRTLIDVESGLTWLCSLPRATFTPPPATKITNEMGTTSSVGGDDE